MQLIIIGCGRVGAGLARSLSQRGHAVTVVDREPTAFARLGAGFQGHTVAGPSSDRAVLLRAGIEHTDGLAAVTGSDATNLVTARLARHMFSVPRVVARLYEPGKAEVYRQLGVQTITPLAWGIQRLAEILCYSQLHTTLSLGSGEVDLIEVELPRLLVGRTVHEMSLAGEMQVAAISRGGGTFLPTLGTVFQAEDVLHLVVLATAAERLKTLLGYGLLS